MNTTRKVSILVLLTLVGVVLFSLFNFHSRGMLRKNEPTHSNHIFDQETDDEPDSQSDRLMYMLSKDLRNEKVLLSIKREVSEIMHDSESKELVSLVVGKLLSIASKALYSLEIVNQEYKQTSKKLNKLESSLSLTKDEGKSINETMNTASQTKMTLEATLSKILNRMNWKGMVKEPVATSSKCFLFGDETRSPPSHVMDMDFIIKGSSSMGYSHIHYNTRQPVYRYKHCDWNEPFSSVDLLALRGNKTVPITEAPLYKIFQLKSRLKELIQKQEERKNNTRVEDVKQGGNTTGLLKDENFKELNNIKEQLQSLNVKLQYRLVIGEKKCDGPMHRKEIVIGGKKEEIRGSEHWIGSGVSSFDVNCMVPPRNHMNFFPVPPASVLNNILHREDLRQIDPSHGRFNVMMLFFDAASRVHFRRMYPSVTSWLDNKAVSNRKNNDSSFSTFDFRFVNTVGHSSKDTQPYLFLGGDCPKKCQTVWDDFKSQGYVTHYTEFSRFKYLKKSNPDILFDQSCYSRDDLQLTYLSRNPGCLGHRFMEQHQEEHLRHMLKFQRATQLPLFSITNYASFHDVTLQGPTKYENSFRDFLQYLEKEKILDDTVVIITSDHGCHLTTYSQHHFAGHMEHYNSLFELIVPKRLKKVAPQFWENLELNRNRYITLNDIYATVRHFAFLSREITQKEPPPPPTPLKNIRRYDLLSEVVPETRSCEDAGINEEMCICRAWK